MDPGRTSEYADRINCRGLRLVSLRLAAMLRDKDKLDDSSYDWREARGYLCLTLRHQQ